ncbi:ral guanine nucleotide dissociation stimulator-like [Psammomys obesus]|uniref:ral guanine nucleotide dissociation stimulator-like n=1 Tax=Psammomys obesus TaxID=48139 RepID=UPI0024534253|nr:ral guanine nucleotide dissociation stimulator-like [Psammomys obesus]
MFCCFKIARGTGVKKDKSGAHGGPWRHRIHSCLQRLWPFSRKEADLIQGSQSQGHTDKAKEDSAPKDQKEPCGESRISADVVEKLVNHLVPSLQAGDTFFVPAFLCTYRRFATTQQVLDLLFKRYSYFRPYCEEDEQAKNTLCSFLDTWIDKNPEEFCQTSDLSILRKLKTYLILNMPYLDLIVRVHMLLTDLQQEEASESEIEDDEDSGRCLRPLCEEGSAPGAPGEA